MRFNEFKKKIARFPVISTSMLSTLTPNPSALKVRLSRWTKKGLLMPLRRGLYVLGADDRQIEPSRFFIANQMFSPSYVSLESALAHYGLIPEFVPATTSVTARKTRRFENEFGAFTYQHVLPKGYSGFESVAESNRCAYLIAVPEKAVVDFLYLNLTRLSPEEPEVFEESYRFQNCRGLRKSILKTYAALFGSKKLAVVAAQFVKGMPR